MKYALIAPLVLGLAACSPAAKEDTTKAKAGEVSEVAPDASASSDDVIVPDESVPQEEAGDVAVDDAPATEEGAAPVADEKK